MTVGSVGGDGFEEERERGGGGSNVMVFVLGSEERRRREWAEEWMKARPSRQEGVMNGPTWGGLVEGGGPGLGCTHLVQLDVLLQALVALGIQVVRPDKHPLLPGRHRKRTDPSHNIRDGLPRTELAENPLVLIAESCVPIHLREIELERTPTLVHLDLGVCRSCEHLHGKCAELGLGADVFDFVDDGGDAWVLVDYDRRDQVLIGSVLGTEVEVGEMASLRERLRDLGHEVFGED